MGSIKCSVKGSVIKASMILRNILVMITSPNLKASILIFSIEVHI